MDDSGIPPEYAAFMSGGSSGGESSRTPTSDDAQVSAYQEDRVNNLLQQISPDNQLMEIQYRIRGWIRDPVRGVWFKVRKDAPEPSPKLIGRYISHLSSLLNQNTTLSNLQPVEINRMMNMLIEWLTDDLDANAEEYGLGTTEQITVMRRDEYGRKKKVVVQKFHPDYTEMNRVGQLMLNITFMVLKRAQNGMESRRVFKALTLSQSINEGQNHEKQGGFSEALKFWK